MNIRMVLVYRRFCNFPEVWLDVIIPWMFVVSGIARTPVVLPETHFALSYKIYQITSARKAHSTPWKTHQTTCFLIVISHFQWEPMPHSILRFILSGNLQQKKQNLILVESFLYRRRSFWKESALTISNDYLHPSLHPKACTWMKIVPAMRQHN